MKPGEAHEGMRIMKLREYEPMVVWVYGTIIEVGMFRGQETALVAMEDRNYRESHLTIKLRKAE